MRTCLACGSGPIYALTDHRPARSRWAAPAERQSVRRSLAVAGAFTQRVARLAPLAGRGAKAGAEGGYLLAIRVMYDTATRVRNEYERTIYLFGHLSSLSVGSRREAQGIHLLKVNLIPLRHFLRLIFEYLLTHLIQSI